MFLALDIGNTNIVVGIYSKHEVLDHWRIASDSRRTADEYAVCIRALVTGSGRALEAIDGVAISSVVPSLTPVVVEVVERYIGLKPLVVGPDTDTGLTLEYLKPYEIGADRIVNAVAAHHKYGGPLVVVDFGTATTFDVISAQGAYLGGAIVPGVGTSVEALFARAARLARIELAPPERAIGRTTEEGLRSGIVFGFAGLVDAMVSRITAELPDGPPRVIATGGLAGLVAGESATIQEIDPLLTLEGLRLVYARQQGKAAPGANS